MAKVPESLRKLAAAAPTDARGGTAAWRGRLKPERRAQFDASLALMKKAQAEGRRISYKAMTEALADEFGYPFTWGALRHYMEVAAQAKPTRKRPTRKKATRRGASGG